MSGPTAADRVAEVGPRLGYTLVTVGIGRLAPPGTRVMLQDGHVRNVGHLRPDGTMWTSYGPDAVEVRPALVEAYLCAVEGTVRGARERAALVGLLERRAQR